MKNNKKIILIISLLVSIPVIILALNFMKNFTEQYMENNSSFGQSTMEVNSDENTNTQNVNVNEDVYIPSFEAKHLNGENFVLEENFDKPIVMNFWATWCPNCVDEMQYFNTFEDKYEDVTFLMIVEADDSEKKLEEIQEYLYKYELDFDFVILDEFAKIGKTYGIPGYPTTLFINKGGTLETGYVGEITEEQLEEGILMIK